MEKGHIATWIADKAIVTLSKPFGSYVYTAVHYDGERSSGCLAATTEAEAVAYMEAYLVRGAKRFDPAKLAEMHVEATKIVAAAIRDLGAENVLPFVTDLLCDNTGWTTAECQSIGADVAAYFLNTEGGRFNMEQVTLFFDGVTVVLRHDKKDAGKVEVFVSGNASVSLPRTRSRHEPSKVPHLGGAPAAIIQREK